MLQRILHNTETKASKKVEMSWDDFDDGGGYDDEASLMGKIPSFAERISDAGFRELLGFENGRKARVQMREA